MTNNIYRKRTTPTPIPFGNVMPPPFPNVMPTNMPTPFLNAMPMGMVQPQLQPMNLGYPGGTYPEYLRDTMRITSPIICMSSRRYGKLLFFCESNDGTKKKYFEILFDREKLKPSFETMIGNDMSSIFTILGYPITGEKVDNSSLMSIQSQNGRANFGLHFWGNTKNIPSIKMSDLGVSDFDSLIEWRNLIPFTFISIRNNFPLIAESKSDSKKEIKTVSFLIEKKIITEDLDYWKRSSKMVSTSFNGIYLNNNSPVKLDCTLDLFSKSKRILEGKSVQFTLDETFEMITLFSYLQVDPEISKELLKSSRDCYLFESDYFKLYQLSFSAIELSDCIFSILETQIGNSITSFSSIMMNLASLGKIESKLFKSLFLVGMRLLYEGEGYLGKNLLEMIKMQIRSHSNDNNNGMRQGPINIRQLSLALFLFNMLLKQHEHYTDAITGKWKEYAEEKFEKEFPLSKEIKSLYCNQLQNTNPPMQEDIENILNYPCFMNYIFCCVQKKATSVNTKELILSFENPGIENNFTSEPNPKENVIKKDSNRVTFRGPKGGISVFNEENGNGNGNGTIRSYNADLDKHIHHLPCGCLVDDSDRQCGCGNYNPYFNSNAGIAATDETDEIFDGMISLNSSLKPKYIKEYRKTLNGPFDNIETQIRADFDFETGYNGPIFDGFSNSSSSSGTIVRAMETGASQDINNNRNQDQESNASDDVKVTSIESVSLVEQDDKIHNTDKVPTVRMVLNEKKKAANILVDKEKGNNKNGRKKERPK